MITHYLDDSIGRILDTLDELHISENTVVFFSSDHGPAGAAGHDIDFFGSDAGLRGQKSQMFEGGLRVPLLVRWPGVVAAQSEAAYPVTFYDFLPTVSVAREGGCFSTCAPLRWRSDHCPLTSVLIWLLGCLCCWMTCYWAAILLTAAAVAIFLLLRSGYW
jgi:hypothetical protein